MLRRRATILLIGAALLSCQLVVPSGEQQCSSDTDCASRGTDFTGSACLDHLCVPAGDKCIGRVAEIVEDKSVVLHQRLRFLELNDKPIPNVPVLICPPHDETCVSPVGAPNVTDASGYVYLTLWKNFRGTIQVNKPPVLADAPDFFKLKIHILGEYVTDDPPDKEVTPDLSVRLLTHSLFQGQLGGRAMLDATAGQIIAVSSDCLGAPRAGIHVAPMPEAPTDAGLPPLLFYFAGQIPSAVATETGSAGLFGVANVPPGPVMIDATLSDTGKRYAHIEIWVNPDTLSNFQLGPTPL